MGKTELSGVNGPVVIESLGDLQYRIGSDKFIVHLGSEFVSKIIDDGTILINNRALGLEYGSAVAEFFLRAAEEWWRD
jgi:hypothetical protein